MIKLLLPLIFIALSCLNFIDVFPKWQSNDPDISVNEKVITRDLNNKVTENIRVRKYIDPSIDSVELKIIYSKGKLPVKRWMPDSLSINLRKNVSGLFPIKISIKVKNTFDNSIIYDSSFTITTFNVFDTIISRQMPKVYQVQSDLIIVEALPGKVLDESGSDYFFDSKQYCQDITIDNYNYADPCLADDGGFGFNGVTGNFVAGFSNYDSTSFIINKVNYCFIDTIGGGGNPYNIVVYADDGNWQPGALLYISPLLFTPPGTGTSQNVTHILTLPLTIPPNSRFYVGYKQTSGANISACYQNEIPVRSKSFFFSIPETNTSWSDFSNFAYNYRPDISPSSDSGKLNVSLIQQGFYNSFFDNLNRSDSVKIYLRKSVPPFSISDSAKGKTDSITFSRIFSFGNSYTDTYYIILKHRNCIETWSKIPIMFFNGLQINYDFIYSAAAAFGNNQRQVNFSPVRFAIYSGDVNQDGRIDLADNILIYNDITGFAFGYISTDLNGDNAANLDDLLSCYNNTLTFVEKITP